jgi:hypothetical protein
VSAGAEAGTAATTVAAVGCRVVGADAITVGLAAGVAATGVSAGAEATTGVVARCASTAPKTATQTTMASAQAAAAKRITATPRFDPNRIDVTLKKAIPVQVNNRPATA